VCQARAAGAAVIDVGSHGSAHLPAAHAPKQAWPHWPQSVVEVLRSTQLPLAGASPGQNESLAFGQAQVLFEQTVPGWAAQSETVRQPTQTPWTVSQTAVG
jgi:hypothetical protein